MSVVDHQALEQSSPETNGRPFLSLPLEIRRQIYAGALPSRHYYVHGIEWMERHGKYLPAPLLALNRQIFDEALHLLYQRDCAIVTVTTSGYHFFDDWIFHGPVASHLLLPDVSSLISNWYISIDSFVIIEHDDLADLEKSTDPKHQRDAQRWRNLARYIAELVQIMSLNDAIHTLTIRFPFCSTDCCEKLTAVRRNFNFQSSVLQSLKQLRVIKRCSFLTTGSWETQYSDVRYISLAKAFMGFKEIIEGRTDALETADGS
ncbi:MAG: hypothetical protein L6R37_000869 [Teloschistes peruensis]|nr:MAG: hypothetical protein L6R37_000869 [Teloschistes peruensis]